MPRARRSGDVAKARALRQSMTLPEVRLWRLLKDQASVRIRRQHPLGPYVLDFYCVEARVCFEIDGMAHDMGDRPVRDGRRDTWLAGHGIVVVRIPARDVLRSPEQVAEAMVARCLG